MNEFINNCLKNSGLSTLYLKEVLTKFPTGIQVYARKLVKNDPHYADVVL